MNNVLNKICVISLIISGVLSKPIPQEGFSSKKIIRYEFEPTDEGGYHFEYEDSDGKIVRENAVVERRNGRSLGILSVYGSYSYIGPNGIPRAGSYITNKHGDRPITLDASEGRDFPPIEDVGSYANLESVYINNNLERTTVKVVLLETKLDKIDEEKKPKIKLTNAHTSYEDIPKRKKIVPAAVESPSEEEKIEPSLAAKIQGEEKLQLDSNEKPSTTEVRTQTRGQRPTTQEPLVIDLNQNLEIKSTESTRTTTTTKKEEIIESTTAQSSSARSRGRGRRVETRSQPTVEHDVKLDLNNKIEKEAETTATIQNVTPAVIHSRETINRRVSSVTVNDLELAEVTTTAKASSTEDVIKTKPTEEAKVEADAEQ